MIAFLKLKTTGSKRISLVIQDKKGKYLLLHKNDSIEFPGFSCEGAMRAEESEEYQMIISEIQKCLGVKVANLKLIETFFDDSIPWCHYIYRAEISSGNPQKGYYNGIYWKLLSEMSSDGMNMYARQVLQKISECAYCRKICDKKSDIDTFIQNYMSHDAGVLVSEILESDAGENEDVFKMAIRYYFSHLRAWLVESPNLKKNLTIQNFLNLYERPDLVAEVDTFLNLNVTEEWVMKKLIRDFVDKNVAHYDQVTEDTERVERFCETIFAKNGKYPLNKFVLDVEAYMMSLIMEIWYYAGEMGTMISETKLDFAVFMGVNRDAIIDTMKNKFAE